jgi:hypothetical protein
MFSQNPSPPIIAVGKRVNKPTQQFKITVLQGVIGKKYTVFINGVAKSFTAVDTVLANIATGARGRHRHAHRLRRGRCGRRGHHLHGERGGQLGARLRDEPERRPRLLAVHADNAVQTDLTAIRAVDDTWYGIVSTFAGTIGATNTSEVGQIAAWTEANQKLYIADVQDSRSSAPARPTCLEPEDALLCAHHPLVSPRQRRLPRRRRGREVPAARARVGDVEVQDHRRRGDHVFTATQQTNLKNKRTNYYYSVAGIGITTEGLVYSGEYVDTIRGRDWLAARLQTRILVLFANAKKVPYTDAGIALVEAEVRAQLSEANRPGLSRCVAVPHGDGASRGERQLDRQDEPRPQQRPLHRHARRRHPRGEHLRQRHDVTGRSLPRSLTNGCSRGARPEEVPPLDRRLHSSPATPPAPSSRSAATRTTSRTSAARTAKSCIIAERRRARHRQDHLLQSSASNDILSGSPSSTRAARSSGVTAGKGSLQCKDLNGRMVCSAETAWVKKPADVTLGDEIQTRVWEIRCASCDVRRRQQLMATQAQTRIGDLQIEVSKLPTMRR